MLNLRSSVNPRFHWSPFLYKLVRFYKGSMTWVATKVVEFLTAAIATHLELNGSMDTELGRTRCPKRELYFVFAP